MLTIAEMLAVLWRQKGTILAITAAAVLVAALFTGFVETTTYQVTAIINPAPFEPRLSDVYALRESAVGGTLIEDALAGAGLGDFPAAAINVRVARDAAMLELVVRHKDPEAAAQALQASGAAILDLVRDSYIRRLEDEIDRQRAVVARMDEELVLLGDPAPGAVDAGGARIITAYDPLYMALTARRTEAQVKISELQAALGQAQSSETFSAATLVQVIQKVPLGARSPLLKLAVALVAGLVAGAFLVLLRHVWQQTEPFGTNAGGQKAGPEEE